MKIKRRTAVLVIGAGPVGLFTALCLARQGVAVQIVDKFSRTALHSYALALHPQSLCLLDELGLTDELVERGHRVDRIAFYRGVDRVGELPIELVGGPRPFVLVLPQNRFESLLELRLGELGVQVHWNHPLIHLEHSRKTVAAFFARMSTNPADGEGSIEETFRLNASFAVGADGYNSFTRRLSKIELARVGPSKDYQLFEFHAPMARPEELSLAFGETTTDALWPLGTERGRWSFESEAHDESPGLEELHELVRLRAPWHGDVVETLEWSTAIRFESCLAERFGEQRLRLAGDSARLTQPLGVQNMNVGLREGHALARRLAMALEADARLDPLDAYDVERRQEWCQLLGVYGPPRVKTGAAGWAAQVADRLVRALPASGAELDRLLDALGLELPPRPRG